jgi:hypothetical protein
MDDINLRDLLRFDVEVAELGLAKTWGDVERIQGDLDGMDEDGRARHPERLFMVAAMVWLARRTARRVLLGTLMFPILFVNMCMLRKDRL